jgi:hypothetical protein
MRATLVTVLLCTCLTRTGSAQSTYTLSSVPVARIGESSGAAVPPSRVVAARPEVLRYRLNRR